MSKILDSIYELVLVLMVGILLGHWVTISIESPEPIKPGLRITVEDNQIDTVYIYRKP